MSRKIQVIAAAFVVSVVGVIIFHRTRDWPALPNCPVPLGELIEKSKCVVHARVVKVESASTPLYAGTNRWIQKAVRLFGAQDRKFATAHLDVLQSVKGNAGNRVFVDYPVELSQAPAPAKGANDDGVMVFLYRQNGAYHPVAYSYGTKQPGRKETERLLRYVGEFVAADKLPEPDRERARAEWYVKLIENPEMRWDGAASWLHGNAPDGEALAHLPANLATRVEAVAFRDEPLAQGDELLLREFAPSRRREVVRRLMQYFCVATNPDSDGVLEEPWRCHGAMQLLSRVAGMPEKFVERLDLASYPNLSNSQARREFTELYLPEIKEKLKKTGLADSGCLGADCRGMDHFPSNL